MASENTHQYIRTMGIMVTILVSIMGLAAGYVTKDAFNEFKEGTISAIISRLVRIETKQDRILDFLETDRVAHKRKR